MTTFVFPRWQFPHNLGDSVITTFIPRIHHKLTGEKLNVLTDDSLGQMFLRDPHVGTVNKQPSSVEKVISVYPTWHSNVFSFWKEHHDYLTNHPTANIITVNYCLQLGIERLLFDSSFDFRPEAYGVIKYKNSKLNIGICPMKKLAGKPIPHPGCDGLGFRFNGPNGLDSWKLLTAHIKSSIDCNIVEVSSDYLGLGDTHIGIQKDLYELAKEMSIIDFGVTTDGGYHHFLNSLNTPIVLFNGSKISKFEFVRLGNSYTPTDLHLNCRFNCPSYFTDIFGGEDKSKACSLECENLDPLKLADFALKKIKELNLC